ncbi:hypothetical protein, partial [Microbispora hainanensis]
MPTKNRSQGAPALLAALAVLRAVGTLLVAMVAVAAFAVPAGADTTWSVVPANADGPDGRTVIDIEL